MAAHWPRQPADDPIAAHLNATPKYVVTKTLTEPDWPGSHVLDGDAADTVQELKAQGMARSRCSAAASGYRP